MPEIVPHRSLYAGAEPVLLDVRSLDGPALLAVSSLGERVATAQVQGNGTVDLGPLPPGGYGLRLSAPDGDVLARTAAQVVPAGGERAVLRYGFVAAYGSDRGVAAVEAVRDNARRLHLTGVQFYDWAFRHADLMGGGEGYADALGNPVDLGTVRALVRACQEAGADALGYAAVYAVGDEEWPRWSDLALVDAAGMPYALGDLLRLVDPAAPRWMAHLGEDLAAAIDRVGFDGFHLDQYGYPKRAVTTAGEHVDVADRFVGLLHGLRQRLPGARLVFNNVNDFPTWATGTVADAVYVEVWEPHVGCQDLADIVTRARAAGAGRPVVVAAYQHVYDTAPVAEADAAMALTMATLFSHGATHLLAGEADRILVDPYYVRNHVVPASTADLLRRWYDFLVEHHDLLMPAGVADVTGSYVGEYNGDLDVEFASAPVTRHAQAGAVWRRVTRAGDRLVVHLVNLVGQADTAWDAPHQAPGKAGRGRLRIRRVRGLPLVRAADPDGSGQLEVLPVSVDADGIAWAELPPLRTWLLVTVQL